MLKVMAWRHQRYHIICKKQKWNPIRFPNWTPFLPQLHLKILSLNTTNKIWDKRPWWGPTHMGTSSTLDKNTNLSQYLTVLLFLAKIPPGPQLNNGSPTPNPFSSSAWGMVWSTCLRPGHWILMVVLKEIKTLIPEIGYEVSGDGCHW